MSVRSIVVVLWNVNRNFRLMWLLPCHQSFADSSSLQMQVKSLVAINRLSGSRSVLLDVDLFWGVWPSVKASFTVYMRNFLKRSEREVLCQMPLSKYPKFIKNQWCIENNV
jgi:hypothetical protein